MLNYKKFCINKYSQKQKRIFKMTVLDVTLTHDQFLNQARKFRRAEKRKADKMRKDLNALTTEIIKAEKIVDSIKVSLANLREMK